MKKQVILTLEEYERLMLRLRKQDQALFDLVKKGKITRSFNYVICGYNSTHFTTFNNTDDRIEDLESQLKKAKRRWWHFKWIGNQA